MSLKLLKSKVTKGHGYAIGIFIGQDGNNKYYIVLKSFNNSSSLISFFGKKKEIFPNIVCLMKINNGWKEVEFKQIETYS